MRETMSAAEARRTALAAQGFARPRPSAVTSRHLGAALRRAHVTQIDSVRSYERAHYLPVFSRLGSYDRAAFDRLTVSPAHQGRAFVEYLPHEAGFIAREDWPLWRFRMRSFRERYEPRLLDTHEKTVAWVRAELADKGPLKASEIERDVERGPRGPWWDWDAVKHSLELLWRFGDVAIAGRDGFERRYALADQVLPDDVLSSEISEADALRELVRRGARALGVATARDIGDYHRLSAAQVRRPLQDLLDTGEISETRVEGWTGQIAYRHHESRLPRRIEVATVLSPFDPVVWFRERAQRVFGLDYRIEIYTPAHKRRFGYYSLPVLVGDRIVARVDLKAERATSTLLVQSAWWQPDSGSEDLEGLATAVRDAAAWQKLENISVSGWGTATHDLAGMREDRGPIGRHRHERENA